jgi:HPt (histidine-containing phosphotransfer) domain-containing protein
MKGSAANVGARAVSAVAFELEKRARSQALENASKLVEQLRQEIGRLRRDIDSFCRKVAP